MQKEKTTELTDGQLSQPLLVSIAEVAQMLRASIRTIERMLATGEIPEPVRLRGSRRWRREDIVAWVDAGCPSRNATRKK